MQHTQRTSTYKYITIIPRIVKLSKEFNDSYTANESILFYKTKIADVYLHIQYDTLEDIYHRRRL